MFSRRGLGFLETGEPPGSNLENMSWVSSAHLRPRSAAFARNPTRWKTSRATSPTRRPRRSSASTPSFLDLIPQTSSTAQLAGGVTTQSRSTNSVQGDVQTASVATFMAINGNGFFAVQKPGNFTDGTPVFDGVDRYTRRGDFQIDKSGYLVNGAGYYLQGVPIDPTTGNPSGSSPQVLRFQNDFLPAQETTRIDYRANLASYPLTTKHDVSVPGSELLAPGSYSAGHNPLALATPAAPYTDSFTERHRSNNKATPSVANTGTTLLTGLAGSDSISAALALALSASRRAPRHDHGQRHRHHLRGIGRHRATSSMSPTISRRCFQDRLDHGNGNPVHDFADWFNHAAFRRQRRSLGLRVRTPRRSPRSASPAP